MANLILNPPARTLDHTELYLTATAELSGRFARIYTTLGTPQDPDTSASVEPRHPADQP